LVGSGAWRPPGKIAARRHRGCSGLGGVNRQRSGAREDFLQTSKLALRMVPDGELWSIALDAGDWLFQRADGSKDSVPLGDVHFLIGTLHLDPYTVRRSVENVKDMQIWDQALDKVFGLASQQRGSSSPCRRPSRRCAAPSITCARRSTCARASQGDRAESVAAGSARREEVSAH